MIHLLGVVAIGYGVIAVASITYFLWEVHRASHPRHQSERPQPEWDGATDELAYQGIRRPLYPRR